MPHENISLYLCTNGNSQKDRKYTVHIQLFPYEFSMLYMFAFIHFVCVEGEEEEEEEIQRAASTHNTHTVSGVSFFVAVIVNTLTTCYFLQKKKTYFCI